MITALLVAAAALLQTDWYVFEPDSKDYRVELPRKPNSTSSRSVSNSSGRAQLTTAQLRTPGATYSIVVTQGTKKIDPKTLDAGIRQFAASRNGRLGPLKSIEVDGNPGREFEFTEGSGSGQKRSKQRWIASGNALFILTVNAGSGADLPSATDRFLGSLEIGRPRVAARTPSAPRVEEEPDVPTVAVKEDDPGADEAQPSDAPEKTDRSASRSPAKTGSRTSRPLKVTFSKIPRSAKPYASNDLEDLGRSFARDRDGFRDVGPTGSVLVGVRVTYVDKFGGPKVRSAQPIYRSGTKYYLGRAHGEVVGPVYTFVARPGYAVGGLVTHTGLSVDGFRMVFMKVDGDRFDPGDQYNSPWIGDTKGGSPGEVNATSGLVVGITGRAGRELSALGLTALR